jgi:hypothetical protein
MTVPPALRRWGTIGDTKNKSVLMLALNTCLGLAYRIPDRAASKSLRRKTMAIYERLRTAYRREERIDQKESVDRLRQLSFRFLANFCYYYCHRLTPLPMQTDPTQKERKEKEKKMRNREIFDHFSNYIKR